MAELSDKHREAGLKKGWCSRGEGRFVAGQWKAKGTGWGQTMDQSLSLEVLHDLAKGLQEDKWACGKASWQDDSHPSNP